MDSHKLMIFSWEQCKLGDLGSIGMNKRIFKEQTSEVGEIPFYKIGTFGDSPDAFISRELFEEYKFKYPYPNIGDILISASGSIGRTVEYKGYDEYFQDSNIVWLRHQGRIDNSFLKQFYMIVKWTGLEGSTIKRLYNKNILDTTINLPSLLEQKKVGNFFKQLDEAITLHQRKLDQLKDLKQAYLQQLFPSDGNYTPKVRFANFKINWEQCKLNKIAELNPKSVIPEVFEYVDLESVVGIELIGHRTENKYSAPSRAQRLAQNNDIFFQTVRPYQKNNYLFELPYNNYVFSTGYAQIRPRNNGYFLLNLVQEKSFVNKVLERCTGTSYPAINSNDLAEIPIRVPIDTNEEIQIGSFFKQLDKNITLHKQKLSKLERLKSAYLQKMFI